VEISSRYEGTILKLHHEIGAIAKVGSPLVDIETEDDVTAEGEKVVESPVVLEAKLKEQPVQATLVSATLGKAFATPAVRRIAKENNVDVNQITGSGPKGRVLKGDILDFVEQKKTGVVNSIFRDKLASLSSETPVEADSIKQLSSIQKAMFKSMTKSLSIPHFGYSDEIIMNATTAFRKDLNSYLKTTKGKWSFDKISYMPIFLKALSEALKQYPILNAKVINADTTPALQFRSSHNIGIAMDTPQGYLLAYLD
jgi:2-oxoisovalerate dehydrogenase E2 component (dihydrolipoyl transacylase)